MKVINTNLAPKAVGPYSQAIKTNGFIFVSGQLGVDPKTNELGKDMLSQANLAFKNIKAILEEEKYTLNDVVKTTVFLTNMKDSVYFNLLYKDYFKNKPARSLVEVKSLPKGALIEIEAIAYKE